MATEWPSELPGTAGLGTAGLVTSVHQQADWLLMKVQNALERHNVVYMESNLDGTLSRKEARKVSVVLYLIAVLSLAVTVGFYYAIVWKPCPKNFFYKSQRLCVQGCVNEDFQWEKMELYRKAMDTHCGTKTVHCNVTKGTITVPQDCCS